MGNLEEVETGGTEVQNLLGYIACSGPAWAAEETKSACQFEFRRKHVVLGSILLDASQVTFVLFSY